MCPMPMEATESVERRANKPLWLSRCPLPSNASIRSSSSNPVPAANFCLLPSPFHDMWTAGAYMMRPLPTFTASFHIKGEGVMYTACSQVY